MKKSPKQNGASRDEAAAVWLHPAKLKPWLENPRAIDDEAIDRVASSITAFGFGAPIVARKANFEIIAGHARWQAATKLQLERVPVRLLDVTAKQAHLLALADNRYTELVDWTSGLGPLLKALDASELELAGWAPEDLAKMNDHYMAEGTSEEIDVDEIAQEQFAHKCPQCGCAFND